VLLGSTNAALDPDAGDEAAASLRGVVAGGNPECDTIGIFANPFFGTNRYRGNVYRFEFRAVLKEIKMQLAFSGPAELHVAIHQKQDDGTYVRYLNLPDVVISQAVGLGTGVTHFYSTADAIPPMSEVILEAGFDYAIAFAWGSKTITYGRDQQGYPVPFRAGQVLGLVAAATLPPDPDHPDPDPLIPEIFEFLQIFTTGAYSMELCFKPEKGACCSSALGRCEEILETECLAGAGSFFHGERTLCAETACIFGACCSACGDCQSDFTSEVCNASVGSRHWTGVACPANPQDLCPEFLGACCRGTTCSVECRDDCEHPPSPTLPGTYRGDGTNCTPNLCPGATGACCIPGGCLNRTQASCTTNNGTYRGPGTTCLTLEPECGGACCGGFDIELLEFCRPVSSRAECSLGPMGEGFPYSAYRGDGTICPNLTPNPDDDCNDRTYVACCLPDGACINTTSGFCQASWVKGVPNPGLICEDQPTTFCPSALRRCCFPDGSCDLLTPTSCPAFGGTPSDLATDCPVNACPSSTPTGACCGNTPGQCVVKTEAQCDALGDLYQGDDTTCDGPNPCPCTSDIQCDDGDDCTSDRCENGFCVNDWHKGATEYAQLADCLVPQGGPAQPVPSGCVCFDLNADDHVDLRDVGIYFLAFESS